MDTPDKSSNRREFFRASGRYLALGGLASLVAFQELKNRGLGNDPNCIKFDTCRECLKFARCSKPKAERFRSINQT